MENIGIDVDDWNSMGIARQTTVVGRTVQFRMDKQSLARRKVGFKTKTIGQTSQHSLVLPWQIVPHKCCTSNHVQRNWAKKNQKTHTHTHSVKRVRTKTMINEQCNAITIIKTVVCIPFKLICFALFICLSSHTTNVRALFRHIFTMCTHTHTHIDIYKDIRRKHTAYGRSLHNKSIYTIIALI